MITDSAPAVCLGEYIKQQLTVTHFLKWEFWVPAGQCGIYYLLHRKRKSSASCKVVIHADCTGFSGNSWKAILFLCSWQECPPSSSWSALQFFFFIISVNSDTFGCLIIVSAYTDVTKIFFDDQELTAPKQHNISMVFCSLMDPNHKCEEIEWEREAYKYFSHYLIPLCNVVDSKSVKKRVWHSLFKCEKLI